MGDLVSVIVPIYNVEPYLRQCVDSILAQTFSDFELILVDDGSPDNCGAICDEYAEKDERVRVIHQANGGLSAARNAGIVISKGKYLTFVDSDDMLMDSFLEKLYHSAVDFNCDIAICRYKKFCGSTPPLLSTDASAVPSVFSGYEACLKAFDDDTTFILPCAKLMSRALFNNYRFPEGKIYEETYILPMQLYEAENVCVLDDKLYCYREREGSITAQVFRSNVYNKLEAIELCKAFFADKNESELVGAAERYYSLYLARFALWAYRDKRRNLMPEKYRIGRLGAWRLLKKSMSPDSFHYYIMRNYPKLVKLDLLVVHISAYIKAAMNKIKKLFL